MKLFTTWHIFCLLFLFELGTSVVLGFGGSAKQDAWIVAAVSTLLGCGLIWMYTKLFEWYPDKNWTSLLISIFGRFFGNLAAFIYILFFIYNAARDLRDFGELMSNFILPQTPLGFIMFFFLILISYACFAGVERLSLLAEISIAPVLLFLTVQFVLLVMSGVLQFSLLAPIASNWKRIATTAFPLGVTVPFGEVLAFASFWTAVQPNILRKAMIFSSLSVGVILVLLDVFAISALGPAMYSRSFYPLLSTFQLISIGDFIDNLDPLAVTNFLIGGLFKITVLTYAACSGIAEQCKIANHRIVILPIVILIWFLAFL
ncbi:spore germination protein [Paenibacillus sp. P26]|nr:spore germination protein [Paenibacillus sp. P26]